MNLFLFSYHNEINNNVCQYNDNQTHKTGTTANLWNVKSKLSSVALVR
jgi:hypothetical protein